MTDHSTDAPERRNRKVRQGTVVSISGEKSCVVEIVERKQHPKYKKMMTTTKRLYVHDEDKATSVGDKVSVMETRPLSRMKRWRVVEIVEKAK